MKVNTIFTFLSNFLSDFAKKQTLRRVCFLFYCPHAQFLLNDGEKSGTVSAIFPAQTVANCYLATTGSSYRLEYSQSTWVTSYLERLANMSLRSMIVIGSVAWRISPQLRA